MKYQWKKWIYIITCALPFSAHAAYVGQSYLLISGTILASSCTVATDKSNLDVEIGTFANNTMTTVGQVLKNGSSGTFNVSLSGCNQGIIGTVVTLSGAADKDNPTLLSLSNPDADDTAKGLAIQLRDKADNIISINGKSALQPLLPGDNTLTFKLAYQVTKVPVYAGNANSVLYLDMVYQ